MQVLKRREQADSTLSLNNQRIYLISMADIFTNWLTGHFWLCGHSLPSPGPPTPAEFAGNDYLNTKVLMKRKSVLNPETNTSELHTFSITLGRAKSQIIINCDYSIQNRD